MDFLVKGAGCQFKTDNRWDFQSKTNDSKAVDSPNITACRSEMFDATNSKPDSRAQPAV